jgi:hypothetical protein
MKFESVPGRFLLGFFCFVLWGFSPVFGANHTAVNSDAVLESFTSGLETDELSISPESLLIDTTILVRFTAIVLNVALGLFGMHRVFLGTDIVVPIFYTFTFGGGGILWLIDLGHLIFKKDIKPFINNPDLLMFWNRSKSKSSVSDKNFSE